MESKVHLLFPTSIMTCDDLLSIDENQNILNKIDELNKTVENGGENWECNTFNSHGTFDLRDDSVFSKVNDAVTEKVNQFANFLRSDYYYEISSGWYNYSTKGSFQEGHIHPGNVFSCVYYASVPENSGSIMFYNQEQMVPLNNITECTSHNSLTHKFFPKDRSLIIFRSFLEHMVSVNKSDSARISLSYNFR